MRDVSEDEERVVETQTSLAVDARSEIECRDAVTHHGHGGASVQRGGRDGLVKVNEPDRSRVEAERGEFLRATV